MTPRIFSNNLVLVASETTIYSNLGTVAQARFDFEYCKEAYTVLLDKSNVELDINCVEAEGNSTHFDSFVDQIENVHWETMKEVFHSHEAQEMTMLALMHTWRTL